MSASSAGSCTCRPSTSPHLYETLRDAGAVFGIADAGYKAIDSLRMEKRYLYWGADISPDDTPYEAGLGFAVSLNKAISSGATRCCAEGGRAEAPARVLRAGNAAAGLWRGGDDRERPCDRHDHLGRFRPFGRPLAGPGCVPSEYFGQNSMEIEAFGRRSLATRIDGCIYDPKNERLRV